MSSIKKRLALFEDKEKFIQRFLKCSSKLSLDSVWCDKTMDPLIRAQAYVIGLSSVTKDLSKVNFSYKDNLLIYDSVGDKNEKHGVTTLPNGFTCFVTRSYDPAGYENSIVYVLYYDGIKWRAYIPEKGNPYDHKTNKAYDITICGEIRPDWNMIIQDIVENIRSRRDRPRQLKFRYCYE